jgi:hypothetical protein
VRKHCRVALISAIALLCIQAAPMFVPRAYAGGIPTTDVPDHGKNKFKIKKIKMKVHKHKGDQKPPTEESATQKQKHDPKPE